MAGGSIDRLNWSIPAALTAHFDSDDARARRRTTPLTSRSRSQSFPVSKKQTLWQKCVHTTTNGSSLPSLTRSRGPHAQRGRPDQISRVVFFQRIVGVASRRPGASSSEAAIQEKCCQLTLASDPIHPRIAAALWPANCQPHLSQPPLASPAFSHRTLGCRFGRPALSATPPQATSHLADRRGSSVTGRASRQLLQTRSTSTRDARSSRPADRRLWRAGAGARATAAARGSSSGGAITTTTTASAGADAGHPVQAAQSEAGRQQGKCTSTHASDDSTPSKRLSESRSNAPHGPHTAPPQRPLHARLPPLGDEKGALQPRRRPVL